MSPQSYTVTPDVLSLLMPLAWRQLGWQRWPASREASSQIGAISVALAGVTSHEEAIARIEEHLRQRKAITAMVDPFLPAFPRQRLERWACQRRPAPSVGR